MSGIAYLTMFLAVVVLVVVVAAVAAATKAVLGANGLYDTSGIATLKDITEDYD